VRRLVLVVIAAVTCLFGVGGVVSHLTCPTQTARILEAEGQIRPASPIRLPPPDLERF
jgi:hypothetical protein